MTRTAAQGDGDLEELRQRVGRIAAELQEQHLLQVRIGLTLLALLGALSGKRPKRRARRAHA